jgi:hypothetical protein
VFVFSCYADAPIAIHQVRALSLDAQRMRGSATDHASRAR